MSFVTEKMPKTCRSCGATLLHDRELCMSCHTVRVTSVLGVEVEAHDIDDEDDILQGAPPPIAPVLPRFVGRVNELAEMHTLLGDVVKEHACKFVLVAGVAGIGKTRFASELRRRFTDVRFVMSSASAATTVPYAPFARQLRDLFGIAEDASPDVARAALTAAIASVLPAARAFEVSHLLARLAGYPFFDSPVVEPLAETPAQLDARTFIALKHYLAALAARAPLCLVFDDIDRAPAEAVNLLHYLAAGLAHAPIMLLGLGRPELFDAHPSFGDGDIAFHRLELGPLSPDEAVQLLSELVRGDTPQLLIEHARDQMDGTPRALYELVRYLVETEVLLRSGDRYALDMGALEHLLLPADLETILAERLELVPANERDVLEKAAACGEIFWLDAIVALVRAVSLEDPDGPSLNEVAAAGDRTRTEVEGVLRSLEQRGLVCAEPHASLATEREYRFAYPPWWDVVYERLDEDRKHRYHRLVAQWLELRPTRCAQSAEEIGSHLERAGDGVGAAYHYRLAANHARDKFYNDRAIRLYEAALGCLGPNDLAQRIGLWHDLGTVFQLKGEFDQAVTAFERMLRLSWVVASRTKAAVAFNKLGRIHRQKGDLPVALEYLQRGLALFEQADDVRGVAASHDDIGQVYWLFARYAEALDHSARSLELRRKLGDKSSIASSLAAIGHIERHRGLFDASEACFREAAAIRESIGDTMGLVQCKNGLGMLAFQRGDVADAKQYWERALADAEKLGALPLCAMLLNHLGEAARASNQRAEARRQFEAAEMLARELDDRRILAEALLNQGLLDLQVGSLDSAFELCQRALELAEGAGIMVDVGRALIALGEVRAAVLFTQGDTEFGANRKAEEYFTRGVELFRKLGNDAELAMALERYGKFRVESNQVAVGRDLLTEANAIFERLGMRAGEEVRRVLGEL
jgi:tetratricopeptide (TPR) repeat protein